MVKREYNEDSGSEEENELSQDEGQYQPRSSRRRLEEDNEEEEESTGNQVGNIKSIRLCNFMCHDNLYQKLGPKINFIVGNNGSGKSAILTGIIICLGAKATTTSRASSLRSLIKEGETAASVTLVLGNTGPEAYKPEVYGHSITVERKILRDSSGGGFKIRSSSGKLISTKKEELTSICDHMKIQADNPISILSQEVAKKFIGSTSPDEKYKFFLKATHLSQLLDDLNLIQETSKVAKKVIEGKKMVIPDLQRAFVESQNRFKQLGEAQSQHEKIQDLKNEMAWAQVVAIENDHEKLQLKKATVLKKIEQIDSHVSGVDQELSRMKSALNELQNRKEAHAHKKVSLKEKTRELKAKKQGLLKASADSDKTKAAMNKHITSEKKHLKEIETRLEQENEKLQVDTSSQKKTIMDKIETLKDDIVQLKESIQQKEQEVAQEEKDYNANVSRQREVENEMTQINTKIASAKKQLKNIEQHKTNHLTAFGQQIPDVLRDIAKEKRWQSPPIGPLGIYIELADKKWTSVIEQLLDPLLNSFMVSNHADQRLLSEILAKKKCHSRVYVSNLDEFDYRHGEPDSQFQTILRTLKFKDQRVLRQLIVAAKIEKTILVENRSDGDSIMHRPPKNIANCYSIDGFQIGMRGAGFGTFALPPFNKVPRLSEISSSRTKEIQTEIHRYGEELKERQADFKELEQHSRNSDQRKRSHKSAIMSMRSEIRNKESEIHDLNQEITETEPANIKALEDKRNDHLSNIKRIADQFRAEAQQDLPNKQKLVECEQELNENTESINSLRSKLDQIQEIIDQRSKEIDDREASTAQHKEKLSKGKYAMEQIEFQIQTSSHELETATSQATTYCPERVNVTKSVEALGREIQRAEIALSKVQESFGQTLEECRDELILRGQAFKKARSEIKETEVFIADLDEAWEIRISRWQSFLKSMSKRTRMNFQYNLAKRGFKGKLEFNHAEQKLHPLVQVNDQTQSSSKERDPKSLSGGEKSFSTICLLLALWESMECPIRCLDEYDVFMDAANRKISTKMIIESARRSQEVQYILITPQSMDEVGLDDGDIVVSRLGDPRRTNR